VEDRTIIQPTAKGSVRRGVRLNGIYEIETLIAQGGMGEVYKGFNIQTNDPVAIKMILPELASNPEAFALFRREASTLHNLQHEAIVRYFVFSVDPDLQRAYLAMEFVDGPSLTKRLTQGPMPLAEVKILQKRIGGALEAAHRFGVIHRDISSDNVILPGNDPNRAKIIDFGIARSQRPGEGTIIGDGFAGKYNYVSPEQLGLAGGEVTAKSDIYSFGLVLAEALRGRPIDMNGTQVEIIEKRRVVPDLSGIDPSVRPLIQSMLQPLPVNRPPSMAAVAAYDGPILAAPASRGAAKPTPASGPLSSRGSSGGRIAGALALLIVIGSVGGVLYVFRDSLPWPPSPVVTPTPPPTPKTLPLPPLETPTPTASPALPPLPSPTPTATLPPNPVPTAEPAPSPAPTPEKHVPTSEELIDSAPPHAPQASLAMVDATLGKEYSVELPAFTNAMKGDGLLLRVDPGPPAGLVFSDLGRGHGRISGSPDKAGQYSFDVVGANKLGDSARMATTLSVTPAKAPPPPTPAPPKAPQAIPPRPAQALLAMSDAIVGQDYSADLPPFSDAAGANGLALHAEPNPPAGLTFADLGAGFGQISGKPTAPGKFAFDVIATNEAGASGHMTARLTIEPPPPPPPPSPAASPLAMPTPVAAPVPAPTPSPTNTVVAAKTPTEKASAFLRAFDGGPCFLARAVGGATGDPLTIEGIGSDQATFRRFYETFIREVGVEPNVTVRTISPAACPAVDLIRSTAVDKTDAPKIDLAAFDIGKGKPLAGAVSNIAGRHLDLLVITNDGQAHRLETRPQAGGASATFTQPLSADAESLAALQILIAIAAPRQPASLEGFKNGPAAELLPRLRANLVDPSDGVDFEFFRLVN
jgi:serine/threonine protein kinase